METKNPTTNHLISDDYADWIQPGREFCSTPYMRGLGRFQGGWEYIANLIVDAADRRSVVFPDANVKIRRDAACVWEALQKAYAQTFKPQAILTDVIEAELQEWLDDPRDQIDLAKEINRCIDANTGFIRRFCLQDLGDPYFEIGDYYTRLSCMRRKLAIPVEDGKTIEGLDASDKSLVFSKIKERHGERGRMFARSGLDDYDRHGAINVNDESHVVSAFMYAFANRSNVCVLTTDRHVFDIAQKLQWFVDTHYRTWLTGQQIATGMFGTPRTVHSEETNELFSGDCELYRKRSVTFDEVMIKRAGYITIDVLHVEHDGWINGQHIVTEPEVVNMFVTKLDTNGLNSSVFFPQNVHIDVAMLGPGYGDFIFVGEDKNISDGEPGIPISAVDCNHVFTSFETTVNQEI